MKSTTLPLSSLNHVSIVVSDVTISKMFYKDVLGFVEVVRPSSFDFQGSWLWRDGMAIHLIKGTPLNRPTTICPLADHISFQANCSLDEVEKQLQEMSIPCVRQVVIEGGIQVDQIFFQDPDHVMIEICNCDSLPICPLLRQTSSTVLPAGCPSPSCMGAVNDCGGEEELAQVDGKCGGGSGSSAASECTAEDLDFVNALEENHNNGCEPEAQRRPLAA